jgi:MraZ protein
MFQGLHNCLLDEKGRVAFPAALRSTLAEMGAADSFVLSLSFYEGCLVGWTPAHFEQTATRLRSLPPSNPAVMSFRRTVIASATSVSIDRAGRISVPKELRDYAALEREVVWAGMDETVELWSKARWDEFNQRRLSDRDALEAARRFFETHGL